MLTLWLSAALADELPEAWIQWKKGVGTLQVQPGEGEFVDPDCLVEGTIVVSGTRLDIQTQGQRVVDGLILSLPERENSVQGWLSLMVCEEDSDLCRPVEIAFDGSLNEAKGEGVIPAPSQELELKREARGVLDQSEDPEATFAQAVESGKRVLLHFTAAWCNACVPLSREVIRNPELQELLSRYEVVEIDADRFEHWSLKHHYKIDVYPTLIVAEPDSRYVGRLEGYSGQEKTLAWLEQGTEMEAFEDLQRRLSKVGDEERGAVIRRLIEEDRTSDALRQLKLMPDGGEKDLLLLLAQPSPRRFINVRDSNPDAFEEWIWEAWELLDRRVGRGDYPKSQRLFRESVIERLPLLPPDKAAGLMPALATVQEKEDLPLLFAMSAALLQNSMTGVPDEDRERYTTMARFLEQSGHYAEAEEILVEARDHFPEEFTYHFELAGLSHRQARHEEALAHNNLARQFAYGDTSLRAGIQRATILQSQGQYKEALALLDEIERNNPPPAKGLKVRSTRYFTEIDRLQKTLAKQSRAKRR